VSTAGGFSGFTCTIDSADGTQYLYTMQGGPAGFSLLSIDPALDLPTLVDAFFAANPD
jgi:hypothetical protein